MAASDDRAECPICGAVVDAFEPGGHPDRPRPDSRCPSCGSLSRHRTFWLFFRERTNLFSDHVRMLHIAPEESLGPRLRGLPNVDYLSADLNPSRAMVATDLTRIAFRNESFDLILASHVLEHIPDDGAAMRELRRVLRPGGKAILAVPVWGATREDLSITDPAERERLYGQDDHVRMYGRDGVFDDRLRAAGFDVTPDPIIEDMDPQLRRRYRLFAHEPIYCCTFGVPVVPRAPTILESATAGDGQATVSWTVPVSDGGAEITGYVVTPYDEYFPLPATEFSSTATTQTVTGLTNGVQYRFRVAAVNGLGTGPKSRVTNPVVPAP